MAQTFDIRFERTAGLASFFAAAENAFRWKGAGQLSIDPQGISFAARRGLTTLLARRSSHRIPAADLREVYREGAALRVEFKAGNQPRVVLPFWAPDRDTAAEIVRLLPTSRTVELEQEPAERPRGNFRPDGAALAIAALAVAAILGAAWIFSATTEAPRAAQPGTIEPEFVPIPIELSEPPRVPVAAIVTDADRLNLAITPGTSAYGAAQRHTRELEEQARVLEGRYRASWQLHSDGHLSTAEFANRLDEHAMRWWDFTFRTLDNGTLSAPDLLDLRAAMLGIARHWRNFLNGYAAGLRAGDHVKIAQSFDSLTRAEEMRARLRLVMGLTSETSTSPAFLPPRPQSEVPPRHMDPLPAPVVAAAAPRSASDAAPAADSSARPAGAGQASGDAAAPSSGDTGEAEPFVPSVPALRLDPGDMAVPIRKTSVAYRTAVELLRWLEKAGTENQDKLAMLRADLDAGHIDQREFIRALNVLDFRWRNLADGLLASPEARTPDLTGFRSTLLSVIKYQSNFLTGYANGLQARDQEAITRAFAERDRADQALERARNYLR